MIGHARPAPTALAADVCSRLDATGVELDSGQRELLERISALPRLGGGIYLHGQVGRGKTWIADRVLESLPGRSRRLHCHAFLADINAAIARRVASSAALGVGLSRDSGTGRGDGAGVGRNRSAGAEARSTAALIASVVEGVDVVMIDDFHVHDIADGELLTIVLEQMRANGTFMVLTSNYAPCQLLPNPLFHDSFLPAIELIEEECAVFDLASGPDHRLESRHEAGFASGSWTVIDPGAAVEAGTDRPKAGGPESDGLGTGGHGRLDRGADVTATDTCGVVRGSFAEICGVPTSAADYLALIGGVERLVLSAVPSPSAIGKEPFQRFVHLIDVLVDADVRLDVESAVDREAFAAADNLPRGAERMLSRLKLLRPGGGSHTQIRPVARPAAEFSR